MLPVVDLPEPQLGGAMAAYLAGLKQGRSRYTTRQSLAMVARAMTGEKVDPEAVPWHLVRFEHATAAKAQLEAAGYSAATINKALAALRGVIKAAWTLGMMETDPYTRAIQVRGIKYQPLLSGRAIPRDELRRVLAACPVTRRGVRDAAIIATLAGCGARRGEAVTLTWDDLRPDGLLVIRQGKGGKARLVPIPSGASEALALWGRVGGGRGALFPRMTPRGEHVRPEALTEGSLYDVCRRAAKRAGTPAFSPHDLRRTMVTDYLDAGVRESVVADIAGHGSVNMTRRYDRGRERALLAAAGSVHVPYSPPTDQNLIERITAKDADSDPDSSLGEGGPDSGPKLGGPDEGSSG